jgi:hypothetical protein
MKPQKKPITCNEYVGTENARRSSSERVFAGKTRTFMHTLGMIIVASMMKPKTLVVHANPSVGSSLCNTIGYMIPPNDDPDAAIPIANPILVEKYVVKTAILGMNSEPVPMPIQNACARRTCQYSWQSESIICPRTNMKDPKMRSDRTHPASYNGPVNAPTRSRRNAWIDPIHDIDDGEELARRSVS